MPSRQEHDTIRDDEPVKKKVRAKQRSDAPGGGLGGPGGYRPHVQKGRLTSGPGPGPNGMSMPPQQQRAGGRMVVDVIRGQGMMESQAYS
ncbi:hypothetical protein D9756_010913 [Leucocoprinus leucothites]|uniref:Uncharacterized protein n=1 Tax=Leucocoprinus leucothites TaxID=201217 RepID=A0A8H5CR97_9AGAR|nr:hypothetical protein D9756_010913 [Leucoagaricus leucothites]